MIKKEPNILLEKSRSFSGRIVKMYQYLTTVKKEHVISKQVLRSGTSIGANLAESRNAQSVADYLNKQNIALKEADETAYWLELLHESGFIDDPGYTSVYADCQELIRLLVSITKTQKTSIKP